MIWTLPNILTIARVLAAPCVVLAFVAFDRPTADWVAFGLFVGAALTDFLDGWLARTLEQVSELGKMLDPIADKAMVIIALGALVYTSAVALFIVIPALVIVLREILVSGLREHLGDIKLPVTKLAKWKTTVQMLAIGAGFLGSAMFFPHIARVETMGRAPLYDGPSAYLMPGVLLIWLAAILTLITGWDYFRKGLAELRKREGVR